MTDTYSIESFMSLEAVRRRVVAMCGDVDGARVLDIGCGDGLIGRALLPRVGEAGAVVLMDHDADAIDTLQADLAHESRAEVRLGDARSLPGIAGDSIDVVVIRAVLLYIPDKAEALAAARRVLVPGGRLVISEPVNRYLYGAAASLWGYDLGAIPDIAEKMRRGYMEDAAPEVRAMTDWSEQDLLGMVLDTDFGDCRMETVTEVLPGRPLPWLAFLHARWTPWLPSAAQVMRAQLPEGEQAELERCLRPQVERGAQRSRFCNLFLTAKLR